MTALQQLLKHQPTRVATLEDLRVSLRDAQRRELDREEFTKLFASALRILEVDQDNVARLFKISRPTVSRWISGESAPHPLGRGPVFKLLEKKTNEKLRLASR